MTRPIQNVLPSTPDTSDLTGSFGHKMTIISVFAKYVIYDSVAIV